MKPTRDGSIAIGDEQEHYTSIAHYEEGHTAAMCGCKLVKDEQGTVRLYQCPTHDAAPDLLTALAGLFQHCVMVHKYWGDGSNQREADQAIASARAAIAKATQ